MISSIDESSGTFKILIIPNGECNQITVMVINAVIQLNCFWVLYRIWHFLPTSWSIWRPCIVSWRREKTELWDLNDKVLNPVYSCKLRIKVVVSLLSSPLNTIWSKQTRHKTISKHAEMCKYQPKSNMADCECDFF